jgi:hypothetical protein
MDWMKQIGDVLDRYGDATPNRLPDTVDNDFDRFARQAPPEAISEGLSAAFRSDQTPEFPLMASQLFGRGTGSQRAGMLNALLAAVGPMVLQQILARRQLGPSKSPARAQGGGLGGVLGNILRGDGPPRVSPEVAEQVSTQEVEEIAREAEKKDPSVIDRISQVYAEQPELLKVLGSVALGVALSRMAQKRSMV